MSVSPNTRNRKLKRAKLDDLPVPFIHKKLGREKADGEAFDPKLGDKVRKIHLDPRMGNKEWLETLIHELLHLACPGMIEEDVTRIARFIGKWMWFMGVRRVYK